MSDSGAGRSYSQLVNADQWVRCAHQGTALLPDGTIELTWYDDTDAAPGGRGLSAAPRDCRPGRVQGSLVFDDGCRAYRSHPEQGRVEVLPSGTGGRRSHTPTALGTPAYGGARGHQPTRGTLDHPAGLAVDRRHRLYIAETGADAVRVVDLDTDRLLRRVALPGGHPVDIAPDCGRALALVRAGRRGRLVVLNGRHGPRSGPELVRPCYPGRMTPWRLTVARDADTLLCPLVLWRAPDGRAVVARPDGTVLRQLDGAIDLDLDAGGQLVVAFGPGLPIRDYLLDGDALVEREPLLAPGFDGEAAAIAPNGRVAFTTAHGYAWTAGSAARRHPSGRVVTYRLDSRTYRTRWGRVFVDACLPVGAAVALRFFTTDADDVLDPIPATPPERGARDVSTPDATPPQAPAHLLEAAGQTEPHVPYRRPNDSELPWPRPGLDDRLETYELPVHAPPGRYLWIELLLSGTERVSPTIGPLRVERPGHPLLRALPRAWSRQEPDADFLQRLLTPAEGLLHELDQRAAERAALIDPRTTPSEALAWLASFAALTLDQRWPESARRTLIAELYPLFRRRGTIACLLRLTEIYLGVRPALIETWRLRGLAGTVLGAGPLAQPDETIGGAGSRTASLGRFAIGGRDDAAARGVLVTTSGERFSTAYDATAHRFTVLVPGHLGDERRHVLDDILADHRPAHTLVEICELGEGMRIGRSTRLGLTAYVGPAAPRPAAAMIGRTGLGVDTRFGAAAPGSRLDADCLVGRVRVG
jgi:phage tail-like protein